MLYPDGEIARCEMLQSIGNIRETKCDFNKFLRMDKTKDFFKRTSKCFCIHDCSVLSILKLNKSALLKILSK